MKRLSEKVSADGHYCGKEVNGHIAVRVGKRRKNKKKGPMDGRECEEGHIMICMECPLRWRCIVCFLFLVRRSSTTSIFD